MLLAHYRWLLFAVKGHFKGRNRLVQSLDCKNICLYHIYMEGGIFYVSLFEKSLNKSG